jgi:hypothetical protein
VGEQTGGDVTMARRRWLLVVAGLPVLLFGLGCLNYTDHLGWEHHTDVAATHGLPPPSEGIQRLGMQLTAVGGAIVGYGSARRTA